MRAKDLGKLVWQNLTRTRFRAALSAFGVVIGTAAIVILFSLATGMQRLAAQNLGGMGPLNEINVMTLGGGSSASGPGFSIMLVGVDSNQSRKLMQEDLDALAQRPGVEAVTPVVEYRGQATATFNRWAASPRLRGYDPLALENFELDMTSGTADLGRWQVLVGAKVGETFTDPSVRSGDNRVPAVDLQGETLTVKLTRNEDDGSQTTRVLRLQVAGVLAPRGFEYDYAIIMQLRDVDDLNTWATGTQVNRRLSGYSQAVVLMKNAALQAELEAELSEAGYFAMSPNQLLDQIDRTFSALQAFVGGIGAITLLIAGTGIANTLITAIYERTPEIGLMKAVGATTRQVMGVFLAEAAAIGGGGGLLGLLVGLGLSQAVNAVAQQSMGAQLSGQSGGPVDLVATPIWLIVLAPLFAAAVGVVAGLYPARRAAALDPVVALRYE